MRNGLRYDGVRELRRALDRWLEKEVGCYSVEIRDGNTFTKTNGLKAEVVNLIHGIFRTSDIKWAIFDNKRPEQKIELMD